MSRLVIELQWRRQLWGTALHRHVPPRLGVCRPTQILITVARLQTAPTQGNCNYLLNSAFNHMLLHYLPLQLSYLHLFTVVISITLSLNT